MGFITLIVFMNECNYIFIFHAKLTNPTQSNPTIQPTNPTNSFDSTLPSIATIQTQDKNRHGLICTPRLFLRTRSLDTFTPPTSKQTRLEQITLDTTHFINLALIGLFPIQPSRILQLCQSLTNLLTLFRSGQLFRFELNQRFRTCRV